MYTLLCLQWITNKNLLYCTGNSAQCYMAALDRREVWGRTDTCICMAESLCCPTATITTLLISYIFHYKIKFFKMNLLTKPKETHRLGEQTYRDRGKGYIQSVGSTWTHCCISSGSPTRTYVEHMELCSTLCGSLDGRGFGGERIHVYVWLSPFTVHLKLSQHCLSAISQYKLKS